jgi:hypothetical protein
MKKRAVLILSSLIAATALVLVGATFAFGGPSGLILDDGHFAKPGSLDDGKDLQSQASISLRQAIAEARRAASGPLGQVDVERYESHLVYSVDVGDQEVRVDANDGTVVAISPQS